MMKKGVWLVWDVRMLVTVWIDRTGRRIEERRGGGGEGGERALLCGGSAVVVVVVVGL